MARGARTGLGRATGRGIFVHGLASFGLAQPEHWIEVAAHAADAVAAPIAGFAGGLVVILADGLVGLAVGLALIPLVGRVFVPAWRAIRSRFSRG